jgi:hypothetical protein
MVAAAGAGQAAEHLVVDQANDANLIGVPTPVGSDPTLDILAGDIVVSGDTITFVTTLAATPYDGSPLADPGVNFSVSTTRGILDFFGGLHNADALGGVAYFGTGATPTIAATLTVDNAAHTLSISAPIATVNELIATGSDGRDLPLTSGTRLFDPSITTNNSLDVSVGGAVFFGGFTTSGNDTARSANIYTIP